MKGTSINSNSKFTKEKEMADFRKWFLALAVLALVALPVSAAPFSCVTNPGAPLLIRDGGLTELVGDVVLQCQGEAPAANTTGVITTNMQIFMTPAQVTNRVKTGVANECPTGIKCVTDALLLITDVNNNPYPQPVGQITVGYTGPIIGLLQSNLTTGDAANTRNSILFPNVTLPYGTTTFVRITNVRVAAPAASNTFLPTQVFEYVTTNPFGAVPITNPQQTVANVQVPLQFAARLCDDSGSASLSYAQCISKNSDLSSGASGKSGTIEFNAKFTEGFALAFKVRGDTSQINPGTVYNTETGLTLSGTAIGGTTITNASYADSGTRLLLNFKNVPAGVAIWVTDTQTIAGTSTAVFGGTLQQTIKAGLVDPTSTSTGTGTCGGNSYPIHQVTITGGAGSATWEVTFVANTVTSAQKSISFGVVVAYTANPSAGLPGLTGSVAGGVSGELAPISTVDYADSSSKIPRFRDNPLGATVFSINPCVSNLLYPFVTNKAGFDTGIAIVNTSLDNYGGTKKPFNTNYQHGACTVYYFDGTTSAPAPQPTADIPAGGMVTFTLQSGGVPGSTSSAQGFQGYIIATCAFQYAHGFAFISDRNTPSIGSQGYLALIIPDRGGSRPADPFTTAGALSGEQLIQ
ncbi:MAG: hypothetical protein ABSE56_10020 [Bryobacteraceae bacterium]